MLTIKLCLKIHETSVDGVRLNDMYVVQDVVMENDRDIVFGRSVMTETPFHKSLGSSMTWERKRWRSAYLLTTTFHVTSLCTCNEFAGRNQECVDVVVWAFCSYIF